MGHLVTDNDANRTIVNSIISIHIKEWRLEDTCREADLIRGWHVVGIYLLRAHEPSSPIDRLA